MFSVLLDPTYWYSSYVVPLLPRGRMIALGVGALLTMVLFVGSYLLRRKRSTMHSREKKFWVRAQTSFVFFWVLFWFLVFCEWFGITFFGNKILLLLLFVYGLSRAGYLAWDWRRIIRSLGQSEQA